MNEHLRAIAYLPLLIGWGIYHRIKRSPFDAEAELRIKYPDLYVRFWTDGTE